jgi:hypothetical protein
MAAPILPVLEVEKLDSSIGVDWHPRDITRILDTLTIMLAKGRVEQVALWAMMIRHDSSLPHADRRLTVAMRHFIVHWYAEGKLTDDHLAVVMSTYERVEKVHPGKFYFPEVFKLLVNAKVGRTDVRASIYVCELQELVNSKMDKAIANTLQTIIDDAADVRSDRIGSNQHPLVVALGRVGAYAQKGSELERLCFILGAICLVRVCADSYLDVVDEDYTGEGYRELSKTQAEAIEKELARSDCRIPTKYREGVSEYLVGWKAVSAAYEAFEREEQKLAAIYGKIAKEAKTTDQYVKHMNESSSRLMKL